MQKKQKITPQLKIAWGRGRPAARHIIDKEVERCPYCSNRHIIKHGRRKNKHQTVQYYLCRACERMFTPQAVKNKHFPLRVILDGINYYNLGHKKTDVCLMLKGSYGFKINPDTLTSWIAELDPLCRYARLRPKIQPRVNPHNLIQSTTLNHQQVYNFCYHPEKFKALLVQKSFQHFRYRSLLNFFDSIGEDFPHHYFQTNNRSSQTKAKFDFNQVKIPRKENYATRLAQLVLQAVTDNYMRHEALQQFMLINDSVTVAMETPIYLTPEDIKYFKTEAKFKIPFDFDSTLTGHIDLLQLRNGLVHILDFKPNARREKPYAQLLLYALALSRLTGLKLMDFKCAWFDENHYFEFFPLQLVHKLPRK